MTARDRWTTKLACEPCGTTGEAKISENDGWTFMNGNVERCVDSVPDGFTVINHGERRIEDLAIACGNCGRIVTGSS